ncbi:helix-turn-helix domain-containing protein [Streptomyces aquilus]|uniref:Helix-turn-helix domain-containing protein n=1 Tax=Streptomyces aquilus TaxID=2548456 RepID=A0A3S9IEQ0_9ACTN|nr:helix-turn-helix domain-containing protein [Streptomyces aquilus]AZP22802.1 helix-turn-helix domain-containing protein [Streptomyces aquilus]
MNQPAPVPPTPRSAEHPDSAQSLGRRLRALRAQHTPKPLSLDALATKAGYTKGYLSKIETGEKPLTAEVARACDRALDSGGELTRLVQHGLELRADVCPYPGLTSFAPADADWFFGREQPTAALVDRLDQMLRQGGLTAVVAPSGAGKSSLLQAGLMPALARGALPAPGSCHWPVQVFTPGRHPLEALLGALEQTTGVSRQLARKALRHGDRVLGALLRSRHRFPHQPTSLPAPLFPDTEGETPRSRRPILIIDQFEELFTLCDQDEEREDFLAALHALAAPARHQHGDAGPAALIVLGIRADYYGHCLALPGLAAHMATGHLPLGPLSQDDLRAAITEPARRAGLELQPGLSEVILRDAGLHRAGGITDCSAEALPLLAHALRATWQQRTGTTLTVEGYGQTGGIHSAIEASAERAYASLPPDAAHAVPHVLLHLVHLGHDGQATRRRIALSPLTEHSPHPTAVRAVVDAFTRARLLTVDADEVTIAHEALAAAWPRLSQWINDDRDGLRIRQQLTDAAETWDTADRDPDLLYRGARLAIAADHAGQHPGTAGTLGADFLKASQALTDHEQRRERRHVRRLRLAVVALTVLLAVTVTAMVDAVDQRHRAQVSEAQAIKLEERNRQQTADLKARLQAAQYEAEIAADEAGISVHCAANGRCFTVGGGPAEGEEP